jgi:hypothetical protein
MRRIKVFDTFDYSDHTQVNEEGEMLYHSAMEQLQEMIDEWQNNNPGYEIISLTQTESQAITPGAHNAGGSCAVHITITVLYDEGSYDDTGDV